MSGASVAPLRYEVFSIQLKKTLHPILEPKLYNLVQPWAHTKVYKRNVWTPSFLDWGPNANPP